MKWHLVAYLLPLIAEGFVVENNIVSLYSPTDYVVELIDSNITEVESSDVVWIVQFYNHWCGHCQRFAPSWTRLAEEIKDWRPAVQVGAINCAHQKSCALYQISSTPTIKLFAPNEPTKEMFVTRDLEVYKGELKKYLNLAASATGAYKPPRKIPRPGEPLDHLYGTGDYFALIFDLETADLTTNIMQEMKDTIRTLPVYAVQSTSEAALYWGATTVPYLIIINKNGAVEERVEANYSTYLTKRNFLTILKRYLRSIEFSSTTTTTTASARQTTITTTATTLRSTVGVGGSSQDDQHQVIMIGETEAAQPDKVYQGDLEKALQYAITKEIAMQPFVSDVRLRSLLQFLETVINYLPNLRDQTRRFLISLREWPVLMNYPALSSKQIQDKVNELEDFYQPFASTPAEYTGCKGSKPTLRGYPCSLWTLFHTLTVTAAQKDPSYGFGGVNQVASSVLGYISTFFSCRECAAHFQSHANSLGYLPQSGNDTVIWLWTLHNLANGMLAGDSTEDPLYPKKQWPSAENCPNCRYINTYMSPPHHYAHHYGGVVKEEFWNISRVLDYFYQVYGAEKIVNNVPKSTGLEDDIVPLINLIKKPSTSQNKILDKVKDICSRI